MSYELHIEGVKRGRVLVTLLQRTKRDRIGKQVKGWVSKEDILFFVIECKGIIMLSQDVDPYDVTKKLLRK